MAAETIIGIKACMKYDSNHVSMTGFNAFALSGRVFKIGLRKLTQILSKNTLNVL